MRSACAAQRTLVRQYFRMVNSYGQERTHHGKLGVQAGVDAELEAATAAGGAGGHVAHRLFWDAAVAGEEGGVEDHVGQQVRAWWDREVMAGEDRGSAPCAAHASYSGFRPLTCCRSS